MSNSKFVEKAKLFFHKFKKMNDNDLSKVSGAGVEPEEFGWKAKGYVTPEKSHEQKDGWAYSQIGNKNKEDIINK